MRWQIELDRLRERDKESASASARARARERARRDESEMGNDRGRKGEKFTEKRRETQTENKRKLRGRRIAWSGKGVAERTETWQRQKRLQEEWGGLRRGCRGPRAVSTTPNPQHAHTYIHTHIFSLSLFCSRFLSVFATASTPMTSKRFHARTRDCLSLSLTLSLSRAFARSPARYGRACARPPETSADLRSRRLGSLMALVGSRGMR